MHKLEPERLRFAIKKQLISTEQAAVPIPKPTRQPDHAAGAIKELGKMAGARLSDHNTRLEQGRPGNTYNRSSEDDCWKDRRIAVDQHHERPADPVVPGLRPQEQQPEGRSRRIDEHGLLLSVLNQGETIYQAASSTKKELQKNEEVQEQRHQSIKGDLQELSNMVADLEVHIGSTVRRSTQGLENVEEQSSAAVAHLKKLEDQEARNHQKTHSAIAHLETAVLKIHNGEAKAKSRQRTQLIKLLNRQSIRTWSFEISKLRICSYSFKHD
ncbi:MAG: hypothetical protein Q9216_001740 [Gyalolechia sp. 2 TL-2023]